MTHAQQVRSRIPSLLFPGPTPLSIRLCSTGEDSFLTPWKNEDHRLAAVMNEDATSTPCNSTWRMNWGFFYRQLLPLSLPLLSLQITRLLTIRSRERKHEMS
jgi:hypothetical protein